MKVKHFAEVTKKMTASQRATLNVLNNEIIDWTSVLMPVTSTLKEIEGFLFKN